ncbi:hypothetical protein M2351_005155 [Azospirillum canadense]|nr:hypothetical protein [Azospirillum canadense]
MLTFDDCVALSHDVGDPEAFETLCTIDAFRKLANDPNAAGLDGRATSDPRCGSLSPLSLLRGVV